MTAKNLESNARVRCEAHGERRMGLFCQHFYPEMISTGMHMTELATTLRGRGWKVTVVCSRPTLSLEDSSNTEVSDFLVHEGIRIRRVPAMGGHGEGLLRRAAFAFSFLLSTMVAGILHRDEFDGFLLTTNPPFLGVAGRVLSALLGKPYILLVYDVYPDIAVELGVVRDGSLLEAVWEKLSCWMLRGASRVVVIGRDMEEVIKEKLDRDRWDRIRLIPNWSDEETVRPVAAEDNAFRREHVPAETDMVVQYSGRLGRTHNLEPVVEAASLIPDDSVHFQMIGDGAKKESLQRLASRTGADRCLEFLPYQPLDELDAVLSASDLSIVCLESAFTGLSVPSKTYGIMASGTALLGILDPTSEIGRTIREYDCGIVLEDPSALEVADLIEELAGQKERLQEMGENGYRAFREKFTLSHAGARYDHLLAEAFYGESRCAAS